MHTNMVNTLVVARVKVSTANTVKDVGEIFYERIDDIYESVK